MNNYPKVTLKAVRVNANLSQEKAAKLLGINKSTLQNYESGRTSPEWALVKKMEKIYNFPADYIFFGRYYA